MSQLAGQARTSIKPVRRMTVATATSVFLLLWFLVQQVQQIDAGSPTGDDIVQATQSGSVFNEMLVASYALVGAYHLTRGQHALTRARVRSIALLLGIYLAWAFLSLLWSVDPGLTFKRYIEMLLVVIGSVGLGLGFYGEIRHGTQVLAAHLVIASCMSIVVLWISIGLHGGPDLLNPAWSAKSFGVGTPIIYPIAFGVFASIWLAFRGVRWRQMLLLAAVSIICLIAIKGRFILAFTVVLAALLPLLELRIGWRRLAIYAGAGGLVAYALGIVAALGGSPALGSIGDTLFAYGTLDGGDSGLVTLTGRTPLWDELGRYFAAQPWLGYGFGAFWNPEFMPAIWSVVGWNAPVAHNGFIDEALATGVIGLFLFLALWLTGIWHSIRLRVMDGDADAILVIAFMVFFLACNLGDSLMQTYARFPFYVSLTALFTVLGARLASRRPQSLTRIAPIMRVSEVSNRPRDESALTGMTTSRNASSSNP